MTYEERRTDVCEACPKHANCTYVECRRTDLCLDLDNIMRGWELGQQDTIEEFERNRLAACDRQAPEETQREQDFATAIIEQEHRQPTFDDAIKYGMQLQRELIANMVKPLYDKASKRYDECLDEDDTVSGYDRSDEFYWEGYHNCADEILKLIIVKEDNP